MRQSRQLRRLHERQKVKNRQKDVACDVATKSTKHFLLPVLAGVFLCAIVIFALLKMRAGNGSSVSTAELPKIEELIEMSDDQIADIGIARVNLACAQGLGKTPDSPAVTDEYLSTLERMTTAVWTQTLRNQHRFVENPAEYENSEIYYKVGMLVTVLGQDFKAHYNQTKIQDATLESMIDNSFFDNPADVFLTGLLGNGRQGTCSSMPVLSVAVGRKLGYPLKLVGAKGHLFFRWDDGKERMNFETTHKVSVYSDDHFKTWPFPINDHEIEMGWYLKNYTPREELAIFLSIRAAVLSNQGRKEAALKTFAAANKLHPHPDYQAAMFNLQQLGVSTTRPRNLTADEINMRESVLAVQEAIEMSRPPRYVSDLPPDVTPPNPLLNSPFPPRPTFPQPVKLIRFKR